MTPGDIMFLLSLSVGYYTATPSLADEDWHRYKDLHGKKYNNRTETIRRNRFHSNRDKVSTHNEEAAQGLHSYNLTLNHLADLPRNKYLMRSVTGLLGSEHRKDDLLSAELGGSDPIPEHLDWRQEGFVTPAWRQSQCGSCYAFTMAAAVQAQVFRTNGSLREMSQQQLVDCSVLYGNLGCRGGSFRNTARYLQRHGLLPSDQYPPYTARQSACRALNPKSPDARKVKRWAVLPSKDETALQTAVARVGPVAVSVDASRLTFQLYHSGVYDDPGCTGEELNHAMLVVGYTPDAWILKNWWGSRWGEQGYIRLRRGRNRCGVADYAVYLTID